MKLGVIASSGGHLFEMFCLRDFWEDKSRFWVSFKTPDAEFLLKDEEKVYWAAHPTVRHLGNLARNMILARRILRDERPDMIVTTGSGVAAPFMWLGRLLGIRCIFIESITRITELSLTARMVYPFVSSFLVQWEELAETYDKAEYHGRIV